MSKKVSNLLNQANELDSQGKYEEAIKLCKKASKIQPDNPEVYYLWGYSLFHQKKCPEAIEEYGKSLQLNRKNALAYASRAVCYAVLDKYQEAAGDFEKAALLEPDEGWPFLFWGSFLERYLKKYSEAKEKYQKALELFQRTKRLRGEKETQESLARVDSLIKSHIKEGF